MKEEQFWILLTKKLCGEATVEELALLQEFINENNEQLASHDVLQDLFSANPKLEETNKQKLEDLYLNHVNRLKSQTNDFSENDLRNENHLKKEKATSSTTFRLIKIVSSIAAVGIGIFFIVETHYDEKQNIVQGTRSHNEVNVSMGSKSKVVLPDGTQVWINSGSKLTYNGSFKGNLREVVLDGEAYFDVVRDIARPFIVHTSAIDIHVLGTVFNVKAYDVDKTIEATLIHGSIEVVNRKQPSAPKVMLKPHEKIIFNKDLVLSRKDAKTQYVPKPTELPVTYYALVTPIPKTISDSSIIETSWVYNKIVFEEEKMSDIAVKLERWYNVKIEIADEKIRNIRLSGSFVDESIEEALKYLQLLIPFKYQNKNNMITISKK